MPDKTLDAMLIGDPTFHSIRREIDYRPLEDWMRQRGSGAEVVDVEGKAADITFSAGANRSLSSISWTCVTNVGNRLFYNGSPFRARCLVYSVTGISWQAGGGWPVYTAYCPQGDYSASMRFRDAKRHQIVPVYGGVYWIGCYSNASGCGNQVTDVEFWVNDDKYDDNAGVFNVTVTGWS